MSKDELDIIQSSNGLIADVRSMVEQTQDAVARTVNVGMTLLYWRIGKRIQTDVIENDRAEYGKEILATLSQELTEEFGNGFAKVFPNTQIVHSLSAQLGWTHFKEIISTKKEASA